MRKQKDARLLRDLYDLTPEILKPQITPVLKGFCRIQGPMDEAADSDRPVGLVDSKKKSSRNTIDKNVHATAVSGTCNACSAPCSSCMHHNKAESVMESEVEDAFREKFTRKEADDFSSMNCKARVSYKSKVSDYGEHVDSEGSNYFSESSSIGDFSENADSKKTVNMDGKSMSCTSVMTNDISKTVNKSRSSSDYPCKTSQKSSTENVVFIEKPDPPHVPFQSKGPSTGDNDQKDLEERSSIQPTGEFSEISVKPTKTVCADIPVGQTGDCKSLSVGYVNIPLVTVERKCSPSTSEESPAKAKDWHESVKQGVDAIGVKSSDHLNSSDTLKQESQNTASESKLKDTRLQNSSEPFSVTDNDHNRQGVKEEKGNSSIEPEEPDLLEDDVKVCDICGDVGLEDLLAVCNKCSDGAEHTYCMRIKLDKIPEGYWLCEECKFKEDAESQKNVKSEASCGILREPAFNKGLEEVENIDNINSKDLSELDNKISSTRQPVKRLDNLQGASTKPTDNIEVATSFNKKTFDKKNPIKTPSTTGNHTMKKVVPQEGSSRSLDSMGTKPTEVSLLSGGSQGQGHVPSNSLRVKGSSSKPFYDYTKARIKHVAEHINQKMKMPNGTTRVDTKKEVNHMIGTSASVKSFGRSLSNVESACKSQHIDRTDGTRSVALGKEKKIIDRRNSFGADYLHCSSSSLFNTSKSSKQETKTALHDGKSSNSLEANIHVAKKGQEDAHSFAIPNEKQQQTLYSEKNCLPNGAFISEDQKTTRGCLSADTATDKLCDSAVPSVRRDAKNKPISSINSRQVVTPIGKILKCQRCNETGHATQYCSINKVPVTALKPAGERNQIHKGHKWKDTVEAALSKARSYSNSIASKSVSAKDQLDDSGHLKNVNPLDGADIQKTAVQIDVKQKAPLPMESADASGISDTFNLSDASKFKSSSMEMPSEKASTCSSLLKASAYPETFHIWKGSFEVHRDGKVYHLYDEIQAHPSSCASSKVLEVTTHFPHKIKLEEAACVNSWPPQFHRNFPTEENIALFFFAADLYSYDKNYKTLVSAMIINDLVLKGEVEGAEILIFPSNKLPNRAQCWNGFNYLWGVLRAKKSNKTCELNYDADHTDQGFCPRSAEISSAEKESFPQQSSTCHVQVKVDKVEDNTIKLSNTNATLCESNNRNFDLNENSHEDKPLEEMNIDSNFSSSPEKASVSGMTKENGDYCKHVEVAVTYQHPSGWKNELPNVTINSGLKENRTSLPHLSDKNKNTHILPSHTPMSKHSFEETAVENDKIKSSEGLIDLEAVSESLPPESVVHEEHFRFSGPRSNLKRSNLYSYEPDADASCEALTRESIVWKEKNLLVNQTGVPKKLKLYHGECASDNELANYRPEQHLFPVNSAPFTELKQAKDGPSLVFSSGNGGGSGSSTPDLELALGVEKEKRSPKFLPLIHSLQETDDSRPKLTNSVLFRDDSRESPNLSLSFLSLENTSFLKKIEQVENASSSKRTDKVENSTTLKTKLHMRERFNLNSSPSGDS